MESMIPSNVALDEAFWRKAAEGRVRRFCGWHVAPVVTETLVLDGRGGRVLLLPSGRVRRLIAVRNEGVDVTDRVDASRIGMLELHSGLWSRRLGGITVELEHGFDEDEAPEVVSLVLAVAARSQEMFGRTVVQQSVGTASVTYGSAGAALLGSEQAELAQYRLGWGSS